MSCFSGSVSRVANARIFARATGKGNQCLAYQIEYAADDDLALILPLPTPPNTAEDAVRFLDLSAYPNLFADMEKGFPFTRGGIASAEAHHHKEQAMVVREGSFVPSPRELARLDTRYPLPDEMWSQFPEYNDFGFAVFKLPAGAHTLPPLAVEFPVRNTHLLFFPTFHFHNGTAPPEVNFDHELYCQARAGWLRSYDIASAFVDIERAQNVLDPNERIARLTVQGLHPNSDILVGLQA